MENEFLKKRAASSPRTKRRAEIRPLALRGRRTPGSHDGEAAQGEQVWILFLEEAPAPGQVGRCEARRRALLAGIGQALRRRVRPRVPAAPDALPGAKDNARAWDARRRPQAKKARHHPRQGCSGTPRSGEARFHKPGAHLQARRRHHHLRTGSGWLFLATVIGLCTRMVVGRAASERMTADIVVDALGMARARGCVAENAIFHSDRGRQHTSR